MRDFHKCESSPLSSRTAALIFLGILFNLMDYASPTPYPKYGFMFSLDQVPVDEIKISSSLLLNPA